MNTAEKAAGGTFNWKSYSCNESRKRRRVYMGPESRSIMEVNNMMSGIGATAYSRFEMRSRGFGPLCDSKLRTEHGVSAAVTDPCRARFSEAAASCNAI